MTTMPTPGVLREAVPAVSFQRVSKRFGPVTAVDGIDLEIASGTLVTLLGPSGCGKTSTLRLIAGLEMPTAGQIWIAGKDVTHLSAAERDVSMVFQSYALFPHMSVLENVCYGLRASGMRRAESEARAADKLGAVGLAGFERRLPSELSGGQQQRVAVARAIVLEPQVLLLDEPLSNLDAKLRRRVREDIRALQQSLRLTVIYVTHDQEEALAVSDRIIVMHNARVVQDGTPRDLYELPATRFIADFIGNANLLPVMLAGSRNGVGEVRLGGTILHVPDRGLPPGEAVLAVRPEAIRVRRGDGEGVRGSVRKASYLGKHMEYELVLDGLPDEVFVTDQDVGAPLQPGERVVVAIAPGGAALVRA